MAANGESQIFRRHARAIIEDADEPAPTLLEADLDASRAGIDGVLDQFLHRRGRAFDHLAGGNLINQDRVKLADGHAVVMA
jgi:hypothetical protein